MHINARTLWTSLAAVVVAAVTLVTLSAQTAARPERPQRPGQDRGFLGGRGPAPMLTHLNLSDAQREQVRAIVAEARQGDDAPMRKVAELRRELHAAVFADSPDQAKIDQLTTGITQAEADALSRRIEVELKIAQVLTPEQRAKARELPGGRGGRGPGRSLLH